MPDPTPSFGQELRRLRVAKGWSLREAAKHLGVAFSRIAEWERGADSHSGLAVVPPYHTAAFIARYLHAPHLLPAAGYPRAGDDDEEEELLEGYRRLDGPDRRRLLAAAREMVAAAAPTRQGADNDSHPGSDPGPTAGGDGGPG